MTERTTETEITFAHPFALSSLVMPLEAGTYRLTVDEEQIEGLSFSAYRRTGTYLEIPALAIQGVTRQHLKVSPEELEAAVLKDTETGKAILSSP